MAKSKADFDFSGAKLQKAWNTLHAGDCEPYPDEAHVLSLIESNAKLGKATKASDISEALLEAWRAFHHGHFEEAFTIAKALGPIGYSAAIKAAGIHAVHFIEDEKPREKRFAELVKLAESAMDALPEEANSHFRYAFALGRYSQCISIAKALTQGLAGKVKVALEKTLELAPNHAEAHTALGLYHAEVVSKVGGLIAGLTYGAKASTGESLLKEAIKLTPDSPIAHIEYGNGLMLLFGAKKEDQAAGEYEKAAKLKPRDAMEKLDAEFAASQIED